ncbi:glycine cleavage system aminomethyltransferase GcvT [Marinomonas sp. S3726]|uniref:glycine cleavage system aminomethyltransferase GcvT n=1 Tax=Marinomonas sp. S3726 TaxID=579484 RepID=UPI002356E457|nr:glycine cleavage system aminomethyltransferase GcvT [Marinomonas sp. S3726]
METNNPEVEMNKTALYNLHLAADARMVEFAGYEMPVQYPLGVKKEHLWVRENAGLFDVSHMGQVILSGEGVKAGLEALMPVDVEGLAEGTQRYGLFTNAEGGIQDDLMFANWGEQVFVVVNAACKEQDIAHMQNALGEDKVKIIDDRSLLAIQGPKARAAMARLVPEVADMIFMQSLKFDWNGNELWVSCSGYTGEDGYEVSVSNDVAEEFANALLAQEEVEWIGLGARDSLRLEAGLCLYGHDIDTTTTPSEAALTWAVQKVRREAGEREGGFAGDSVILPQLPQATNKVQVSRKRLGFIAQGKAPVREGVEVVDADDKVVGVVTSGGFAPSLSVPILMAYVSTDADLENVFALVRGKKVALEKAAMPFVTARYYRG